MSDDMYDKARFYIERLGHEYVGSVASSDDKHPYLVVNFYSKDGGQLTGKAIRKSFLNEYWDLYHQPDHLMIGEI